MIRLGAVGDCAKTNFRLLKLQILYEEFFTHYFCHYYWNIL